MSAARVLVNDKIGLMARARLWIKVTVCVGLVAVLGGGAALVGIKMMFPEPKARAYVIEAARKQLGREVRLTRIDAGLTGLHLQGLEISERPNFDAGTFVSVETFSVRPSWRALLQKKLVIVSATADGLKVNVVKSADGAYNFSTLASSGTAAASSGKSAEESPPGELNIRSLRVTRGTFEYRAPDGNFTVTEFSLKLDDVSMLEPFQVEASMRAKGKYGERPVDAQLGFAGTVNFARGARDKFWTNIKRLSIEQEGVKLTAKGKITGLDAVSADLDAAISYSGKTLLEAKGLVTAGSPAANGARAIGLDMNLKTPGLDTTLVAKWAPGLGLPAIKFPAMDAAVVGRWEGDAATFSSLRVKWPDGKLDGSGSAMGLGGKSPVYAGTAKFGFDLPEIKAGQYTFIKLPPKSSIPAMRLDGEAAYAGGDLTLTSLAAKFKQGTASASGSVRKLGSAKPVPDLSVTFAVDLPSFKISEAPLAIKSLPQDFVVPAMRLDGGARARGDSVTLDKAVIKGKSGTLRLDGTVSPAPDLEVQADLDLPALTEKDLPFPGVTPGLELPPSRWDADLSYTSKAIRLRRLGVKIASNELSIEGGVTDPAGRGAFDLLLKCKRFVLDELTRLTPNTRDLKLTGSGFFALSVTGTKEKPVFGGKLQFKDLGAVVSELPLSGFTGTVSFDERRIDVPNLKGQVADGTLKMDLTIKEYAKVPEIQIEASLDRFDLGKYLSAQKKLQQDAQAAKAAKAAKTGKAVEEKPAAPIRTRGKVTIASLFHPNAQLQDATASWDLWGVTPDMKRLNGDAQLGAGEGKLKDIAQLAIQSPTVKVMLTPILIIQKLSFGVDLNNIAVLGMAGDYAFKDGLMTLRKSTLDAGAKAQVSTLGTIDLPSERLDLTVNAHIGTLPAADFAVTGTISEPKSKLKVGKLLENAGKNLLNSILIR